MIEILSESGVHRAAVASFDTTTDEDVISQQVTDRLGKQVHTIEKEMRSAAPTTKTVNGYTELVWSLNQDPRRVYRGTFYVSSEQNPNFDVVLGRTSTQQLDASQAKSRRSF